MSATVFHRDSDAANKSPYENPPPELDQWDIELITQHRHRQQGRPASGHHNSASPLPGPGAAPLPTGTATPELKHIDIVHSIMGNNQKARQFRGDLMRMITNMTGETVETEDEAEKLLETLAQHIVRRPARVPVTPERSQTIDREMQRVAEMQTPAATDASGARPGAPVERETAAGATNQRRSYVDPLDLSKLRANLDPSPQTNSMYADSACNYPVRPKPSRTAVKGFVSREKLRAHVKKSAVTPSASSAFSHHSHQSDHCSTGSYASIGRASSQI